VKSILIVILALVIGASAPAETPAPSEKTVLLREILALQETQLSAAESDLTKAQNQFKEALANQKHRKLVAIVVTAAGIAGMVAAMRITRTSSSTTISLFSSPGTFLTSAGGGVVALTGATLYAIPSAEVPKWQQAVAERLENVKQAKERVKQLQEKLEGEKK
jgi:cytochrome c biogenesis protein CcdA